MAKVIGTFQRECLNINYWEIFVPYFNITGHDLCKHHVGLNDEIQLVIII